MTHETEICKILEICWRDSRSLKHRYKICCKFVDRNVRLRFFVSIVFFRFLFLGCQDSSESLQSFSLIGSMNRRIERIWWLKEGKQQTGCKNHPHPSEFNAENHEATHHHASVNFPLFLMEEIKIKWWFWQINFGVSLLSQKEEWVVHFSASARLHPFRFFQTPFPTQLLEWNDKSSQMCLILLVWIDGIGKESYIVDVAMWISKKFYYSNHPWVLYEDYLPSNELHLTQTWFHPWAADYPYLQIH